MPLALWALCVREARRRAGLSQDELARAAAVTQQTISKIEAGKVCPHDGVKVRLAIALGISPGALFPWPPTVLWVQMCDLAEAFRRLRLRAEADLRPLDAGRDRPATDD